MSPALRTSPYLREILELDPERDAQRIAYLDTVYEFPFDTTRSLEFALFRTFGSPAISSLLDATGEFAQRAQTPLRRHGPDPQRRSSRPATTPRRGQARPPAHEPPARPLRDRERGLPLRALDVRLRADPLERALRLATLVEQERLAAFHLLARGRPADGDQGHPRAVRRPRALQRRVRARELPLRRLEQARRRSRRGTCSSPGFPASRNASALTRSRR